MVNNIPSQLMAVNRKVLRDRQRRTQMSNTEKKSSRAPHMEAFNQCNYLTVSASCAQKDSLGSR